MFQIKQQKIITIFVDSKASIEVATKPLGISNPHQSPQLKSFRTIYQHSGFWRREDEKFDRKRLKTGK
jgi:hypothetical protein